MEQEKVDKCHDLAKTVVGLWMLKKVVTTDSDMHTHCTSLCVHFRYVLYVNASKSTKDQQGLDSTSCHMK